jgi:hypothetical protein
MQVVRQRILRQSHHRQIEPVVDNDSGLQLADHFQQFNRAPVIPAFTMSVRIGIRKIKPQNIDLPIIGEQLPDLVMQIGFILVPILTFV